MADEIKHCKGCGAEIIFRKTIKGKWMVLNPEKVKILKENGYIDEGWIPHWATCPKADDFRKEKKDE